MYRRRRSTRRVRRAPLTKRTKRTFRRTARKFTRRIPRGVSTLANIPRIQKLRYVDTIEMASSAGAVAGYKFRANSLYDPDYAFGGHQPMRFDQLSQFYARYTVIGSKITVSYIGSVNTSNLAPMQFTLYLDDNTSPPSTLQAQVEQGKCAYRIISQNAGSKMVVSKTFSAKKFFGISNIKDNMYDIGALVGANPGDEAYFQLSLQALDQASTVSGTFFVKIEYLAIFSEPIDLAQS